MLRRTLLRTSLSLLGTHLGAQALATPQPRSEAPPVALDPALVAAGVAQAWAAGMRRDLGWQARWQPMPTEAVLAALREGQVALGAYLRHPEAQRLAAQGLIHGVRPLARTDVLLAGPADDPAGIRGEGDPGRALAQVMAGHAAGACAWQPPPAGSALAALAATLGGARAWPTPPRQAGSSVAPNPQAYRLMTRADWLRLPPSQRPARIWLAGGPGLQLVCELARSLNGQHPGARLMSDWLAGPIARRAWGAPQRGGWLALPD